MIARTFLILATILTISGCSIFGSKPVEIISQPVKIDIIQPTLPREISLQQPTFYVVSEAVITNPCKRSLSFEPPKFNDEGIEQLKRPKTCELSERENPEWPVGYTYLDRFLDDMKALNSGDIVFVASTVKDYELMTANFQELRRYIRELGEVIVYYRDVTIDDMPGVAAEVQKK
jgi:hypothetical protein